jgi:hypothetical protein
MSAEAALFSAHKGSQCAEITEQVKRDASQEAHPALHAAAPTGAATATCINRRIRTPIECVCFTHMIAIAAAPKSSVSGGAETAQQRLQRCMQCIKLRPQVLRLWSWQQPACFSCRQQGALDSKSWHSLSGGEMRRLC